MAETICKEGEIRRTPIFPLGKRVDSSPSSSTMFHSLIKKKYVVKPMQCKSEPMFSSYYQSVMDVSLISHYSVEFCFDGNTLIDEGQLNITMVVLCVRSEKTQHKGQRRQHPSLVKSKVPSFLLVSVCHRRV